jgi:hypothetical protein
VTERLVDDGGVREQLIAVEALFQREQSQDERGQGERGDDGAEP